MIAVDVVVVAVVVIDAVVVFMTSVTRLFVDFCLCSINKQLFLLEVFYTSFFVSFLQPQLFCIFFHLHRNFSTKCFHRKSIKKLSPKSDFRNDFVWILKSRFRWKKNFDDRCQNEDICKTQKRLQGLIFKWTLLVRWKYERLFLNFAHLSFTSLRFVEFFWPQCLSYAASSSTSVNLSLFLLT